MVHFTPQSTCSAPTEPTLLGGMFNSKMGNEKLFEAACEGKVEVLHDLLQKNPLVLTDVALASPPDSLLHVAAKAKQHGFVRELLKYSPELARELSKDGFRPLDIASAIGTVEIVKEILRIDNEICLLRGRDRRTALHYAAIKGKVGVIDLLLSACPVSVNDVTIRGETALHLAVENHQFEAFGALLNWLESLGKEDIINWRDCDGNTVLHLAAYRKQLECVKLLLSQSSAISATIEVDAKNSKGLTATDILDIVLEGHNDVQIRNILQFGAPGFSVSKPYKNWFEYFRFQLQRDSPSEARNALLVVAALIATVTFQAGVSPPNGMVKSAEASNSGEGTFRGPPPPAFHPAVTSGLVAAFTVLGSHATSYLFLFANTLGLAASLSIIIYLTVGFPFQRELLIATCSMMFAYGFSISSITEKKEDITYLLLGIAFALPFSVRWLPIWGRKFWKWRRQHFINHAHSII